MPYNELVTTRLALTQAIGSPCVAMYGLVIARTRSTSARLYGLIDTTMFPLKTGHQRCI